MLNSSVPKTVRSLVIISAAFLIASLGISGFNAYVTLAAPPQAPHVPTTVGFEGQLANADGNPVADGDYGITFNLYDVASGGSALWAETQTVTVTDGLYSVQLGAISPLDATFFEGSRWLGLKVGTDSEMTPRIPIGAVPFALNAQQTMGIQGRDVSVSAPMDGNVLKWDATGEQWTPGDLPSRFPNGGAQTISSDAITVEGGYFYLVDTEGSAATDDLSTINGGEVGDIIMLQAANAARTPVLKNSVGNIRAAIGDVSLIENKIVTLRYDGSNWYVTAPHDRYVTMWFPPSPYTSSMGPYGSAYTSAGSGRAYMTILVPDDFETLVSLELLMTTNAGAFDSSYSLWSFYFNPSASESWDHHSVGYTDFMVHLPGAYPIYVDVSGMFPSLAVGDVAGLRYENTAYPCCPVIIYGLRMVYKSTH